MSLSSQLDYNLTVKPLIDFSVLYSQLTILSSVATFSLLNSECSLFVFVHSTVRQLSKAFELLLGEFKSIPQTELDQFPLGMGLRGKSGF